MKTKLKWGILGAGLLADERIAPAILESKNSELAAVYARSKIKAKKFAEKFNISNYYSNKEKFIKNSDIDVVYISTPNAFHFEDILLSLKAKKNVFCEKPMTTNLEDANKIQELCKFYKVKFGLAFMFPFHPLSVQAKKWIEEGRVGDILLANANFIHDLPECEKINAWRFNPKLSGGGTVIEVGCHCVDILNFLLNKKVISVSSTINLSRNKAPCESVGIINLIYNDNTIGLVTVSNNLPGAAPYRTNFEIHGIKGSIIGIGNLNRNPSGKLIYRTYQGKEEIISLPDKMDNKLYIDEIESFSSHVLTGSYLYSDIENSITNMNIIMSAYRSAEIKKTIIV